MSFKISKLVYYTYIDKWSIFILRFNLTCQAFRVLAFSPLSAEVFNVFILSNATPDVNSFHGETCFLS